MHNTPWSSPDGIGQNSADHAMPFSSPSGNAAADGNFKVIMMGTKKENIHRECPVPMSGVLCQQAVADRQSIKAGGGKGADGILRRTHNRLALHIKRRIQQAGNTG